MFVAVYQRALKLLYVDALLQRVRADFAQQYAPKRYDYASFEELFRCSCHPSYFPLLCLVCSSVCLRSTIHMLGLIRRSCTDAAGPSNCSPGAGRPACRLAGMASLIHSISREDLGGPALPWLRV